MEIKRLNPKLKKRAGQVAADAFYNYPSFIYYFPDQQRRTRWLPWYMARVLNCALMLGEVWVTEDVDGVLFILPPRHTRVSNWNYVKAGLLAAPLVTGLRQYPRISECETYLTDTQAKLLVGRSHYYLWGLVVDPSRQRTGVGTALLVKFLRQTDAEGLPVYLETHQEGNVAYYEQRGFQLIHTDIIPKHGLDFWCLLHEPPEP